MPRRILHVEDNEEQANMIDGHMRQLGCDVVWARDPAEARQVLVGAAEAGQTSFGGIVADLRMKDPQSARPQYEDTEVGVFFLQWVRNQPTYEDVPIVVLSAYSSDERMLGWKHLLRIGEVIQKPATFRLLDTALTRAFAGRSSKVV